MEKKCNKKLEQEPWCTPGISGIQPEQNQMITPKNIHTII